MLASTSDFRILKDAYGDLGYPYLRSADVEMLSAFLARFDQLGWIPPLTGPQRQLLLDFGVVAHSSLGTSGFYEFCSQGARGERAPRLTIFFHLSAAGRVRICAILLTTAVTRRPGLAFQTVDARVRRLERWLARHAQEM